MRKDMFSLITHLWSSADSLTRMYYRSGFINRGIIRFGNEFIAAPTGFHIGVHLRYPRSIEHGGFVIDGDRLNTSTFEPCQTYHKYTAWDVKSDF